jgi:hypothetical protein
MQGLGLSGTQHACSHSSTKTALKAVLLSAALSRAGVAILVECILMESTYSQSILRLLYLSTCAWGWPHGGGASPTGFSAVGPEQRQRRARPGAGAGGRDRQAKQGAGAG